MGFYATAITRSSAHPRVAPKPHYAVVRLQVSGQRYYNPWIGRWPNRDPLGELGLELLRSVDVRGRSIGSATRRLINVLQREGYTAAEIHEILSDFGISDSGTVLLPTYVFVGNTPLNAIDPLGDMPKWLEKFLEWLKNTGSYVCPGSEATGAAECAPGIANIAVVEAKRKAYLKKVYEGASEAEIDKAYQEYLDAQSDLQDRTRECLEENCPCPKHEDKKK